MPPETIVAPASSQRPGLPAERDVFVGRQFDLLELQAELQSARLVTVLGPGGVGKTRFVTHFGREVAGQRWPGGVWFCDLAEARDEAALASAVARCLEVPLGRGDPLQQLGHALAARGPALVILDNFEQLCPHAESTVGRWMDRAPLAAFLVTSRSVLGLVGEQVFELPPLPPQEAFALFEVRAKAANRGYRTSDPAQLVELVERLDRLPLAIELCAARVRGLSVSQLAQRWRERLELRSGRGRQGRHATLRAVLDSSWELLSEGEQRALAWLSVFEGSFSLEAAEAVLQPHGEELAALIDHSLVRRRAERFQLLVLVRQYAGQRLDQSGQRQDAERAHGRFYAQYGTEEEILSLNRQDGHKRQQLQQERDNLLAACRRALQREDAPVALATAAAAWEVLQMQGPLSLAVELTAALSRTVAGCRPLFLLGAALQEAGLSSEARPQLEAALEAARAEGLLRPEGLLRGRLGQLHAQQGDFEQAHAHLEAALAISRAIADREVEACTLSVLSYVHTQQSRLQEAHAQLEVAREIFLQLGSQRFECGVRINLAGVCWMRGELQQAIAHGEAALAASLQMRDRHSECIILGTLGNVLADLGRPEEALAHLQDALAVSREVGHRRGEGIVLGHLASLDLQLGRLEQAQEALAAALAIHREVGNPSFEALALGYLVDLHKEQEQPEEARTHYEAALEIVQGTGKAAVAGLLGSLGLLHADQGRPQEASACLEQGYALLPAAGGGVERGLLLCLRAQLDLPPGERARALEEARALAHQLGAGPASPLGRALARARR